MTEAILGLDLSLACPGWAVMALREDKVLAWGKVVNPPAKKKDLTDGDYFRRVKKTVEAIDAVFEDDRFSIVSVGVEQLNSFKGISTARKLLGVSKVVQFHIWDKYGLTPNEIETTKAKKAFTGKGDANKSLVLVLANTRFKLSPPLVYFDEKHNKHHESDDDIADAIAIAYTLKTELGERLISALDNKA